MKRTDENAVLRQKLKMLVALHREALKENVRLLIWKGEAHGLTRDELKTLTIHKMVLGPKLPKRLRPEGRGNVKRKTQC